YPFERKKFWKQPAVSADEQRRQESSSEFNAEQNDDLLHADPEELLIDTETSLNQTNNPILSPAERRISIKAKLSEIIETLSGTDVSQLDGGTSFLEMGFDSLFLTQVTQEI